MALAKLTIDLEAKLANFAGDLGKAARASEETAKRMNSAFGTVKATLVGLAAGVSLQGIISFAKATIDSLDALNDLKDATGSSIENISALEDVAKRTGTSFETVSTSLIKFNKVLGDAKPGSETEAALKAIGLSATELKQIDPAEALLKTATALAGFADDGNKARLTQELFGKSLKEVAPFLKDLAEKGALNATVTTAQAEAAETFNKQLFELKKNAEDAARSLTSNMVPALNEILKVYTSKGLLAAGAQLAESLFGETTIRQANLIKLLKSDISDLRSDFVGAKNYADQSKIGTQIDAKVAELKALEKVYFKLTDGSVGGGRGTFIKSNVENRESLGDFAGASKTGGAKAKPFQLQTDSLDSYIESLRKELEVKQELSTVEKTRNLIAEKGGNFSLESAGRAIGFAQQVDAEKLADGISAVRAKTTEASVKYIESLSLENNKIFENNEQKQRLLEELGLEEKALDALQLSRMDSNIQREKENLLVAQNIEGNELEIAQIERRIALLQQERDIQQLTTTKKVNEALKATQLSAKDVGSTFKDSFTEAIMAGKDFQGVLGAIGDDLAKLIIRRSIVNPAADFLSGAVTSGLGAIFGGSFDGGGYTGSGSRSGGLDGKGGFMAMLHPNETVLDHTRGQGGGSINVVQNFTVGDVASVSLVRQAVAGSERRIASAIGRSRMYGGALS